MSDLPIGIGTGAGPTPKAKRDSSHTQADPSRERREGRSRLAPFGM